MASYRRWTEFLFSLIFTFVSFCPVPETSCVSYPINHQGMLPSGNKIGNSLPSHHLSSTPKRQKQKKKQVLSVSKNLFQKLAKNQAQLEREAERELAENKLPDVRKANEQERKQITNPGEFYGNPRRFPESVMKSSANSTHLETKSSKNYPPIYDCPRFNSANPDGTAIIKADPVDCSCYYYCGNYGIHHIMCCPWPLLWNDDIKSCDWYWKVFCYTSDYWKK